MSEFEDVLKAQSPDETLKNEAEAERTGAAATSTETLSLDEVQKKALDKFNMINKPTDRATSENLAKLAGQINSAEQQIAAAPIYQGTAHPEHQTYGAMGVPIAALTHDYDEDSRRVVKDTAEVKKHNDETRKIREALDKGAEKESDLSGADQVKQS
jgi:hypothetical protein